jgi:hypothetical protein
MVSFKTRQLYSRRNRPRYTLYGRLGGPTASLDVVEEEQRREEKRREKKRGLAYPYRESNWSFSPWPSPYTD